MFFNNVLFFYYDTRFRELVNMDTNTELLSKEFVQTVKTSNNKDLVEHGISFHWWTAERTSLHCHTFYEFFIITQGQALHIINGDTHEVEEGMLCLVEPNDRHKIISAPGGCIHMNICLTEEKLSSLCNALGVSLYDLLNTYPKYVQLGKEEMNFLIKRGQTISLIAHNAANGSHIIMSEFAAEAVSTLCNNAVIAQMDYPKWFTEVLKKIHAPENIGCSAADVYRFGGFSAPAMIRYFKLYTGKTVNEYIRHLKIDYAKEVLRDTDISLPELSNLLGYSSLSHFSRTFKEHTGISPAAYRKIKKGSM